MRRRKRPATIGCTIDGQHELWRVGVLKLVFTDDGVFVSVHIGALTGGVPDSTQRVQLAKQEKAKAATTARRFARLLARAKAAHP